ncbi:MAG: hypothetical protein ABSH26_17975 [Opitutaceae bacterium]|jgi:hypothetical protein
MNQFEFLSVFVSIIIALGISNILSSAMRLIRRRGRVRMHFPTLVWMAVLFLLQLFIWWLAFQRREWTNWTFFRFLLYLLMPILVSVPGYLLVPEIELELTPEYDLEAEFNHNRRWFFALLAAMGTVSFVESAVSATTWTLSLSSVWPLASVALCIGGFWSRAKWAQLAVAFTFLAVLLGYIGVVFSRL